MSRDGGVSSALEPYAPASHARWQDIGPDSLKLPASLNWLAYWRELGGASGDPPARTVLNMPAQRPGLCQLALWVQRLDDGEFLFRLAGEEVRRRFGARLAGFRLSDIPLGSDEQDIRRCYQTAIENRAPTCARGYYDFGRGPETRWEACILPFADPQGRVSHLLVGMAYA